MYRISITLAALVTISLCACGDDSEQEAQVADAGATDAGKADAGTITWHGEVRAIVEGNCVGCHVEGGAAPFPLDTYAAAAPLAGAMAEATRTGRMPPWKADPDCRPMVGERLLEASEIAAIGAWAAAGAPEGQASAYAPPAEDDAVDLGAPDIVSDPGEDYTADPTRPDDYRCFVVDHDFAVDTWVTAVDFAPGERKVVHHIVLFLVEPEQVPEVEQRDAAEPGPGYTCYGGTGTAGTVVLAAWVPGAQPTVFPEGAAARIAAGARLVTQVHYNTLATDPVPADRSAVQLWTLESGQTPKDVIDVIGLTHAGLRIEAGDAESVQSREITLANGGRFIGVLPHMHQLGRTIRLDLVRSDGESACMADIPDWDFNWQQTYFYTDAAWVDAEPLDRLRFSCVYDNSVENQPTVNGERLPPRDVTWGEGTLDEMCLFFLYRSTPYAAEAGEPCPGLVDCVEQCPSGDEDCFFGCTTGLKDCNRCIMEPVSRCALGLCPTESAGLAGCLQRCEEHPVLCIQGQCAAEFGAFYDCAGPHLLAGACDEALAACDVAFGAQ